MDKTSTPSITPQDVTQLGGATNPLLYSVNHTINPAEDFYSYVNSKWQQHVHLPSYSGSFGVSEEIERNVQDLLLSVIEKHMKKDPSAPVSMFAHSLLHVGSQKNSIIDLQMLSNQFDCMTNVEDICYRIGFLNKIQSRAPISCIVSADYFDNTKCNIYIYECSLGLEEKKYYDKRDTSGILLQYRDMLKKFGEMLNIESLESSIVIESTVINYLTTSHSDFVNVPNGANTFTFKRLTQKYRHVAWEKIMEGWGMPVSQYKDATFIVKNLSYMAAFNRMFRTFSIESWRVWMRSMLILSFVEYLPPPFDDLHFQLYGKALRGNTEKMPQKLLTLKVLGKFASQDLSRIFVEYGVPEGTKKRATHITKKLIDATVHKLEAADWLSSMTRNAAIDKVKAMRFQVAYPTKWESETARVKIDAERPLQNIINLTMYDTHDMIHDMRRGCRRRVETWTDGAFEVNAYYYPEGNMMVIPAGILRFPFFDLKRSHAWNMGGIGAAIGHEITHGFDEEGHEYDADGNYNNWWTDEDIKRYKKMTRSLIKLFDGVDYMGGKVDGSATLSENLADLGGLAIALEALNSELPQDLDTRIKAWREFFTSYAVSWRNKDRPRKAQQSLLLDLHSPAVLRVNLIVKQFEEFYMAFNISASDKHYIPPERRIKIW